MRDLPPAATLRAFDVATRHSIFTFAATGLCVTQSAVSHQRRHLEALWGVMLFQGNNPATAPAGAALAPVVCEFPSKLESTLSR